MKLLRNFFNGNEGDLQSTKAPPADVTDGAYILLYSRWESNPNLRFRKPPFYPLTYRSNIEIGWHGCPRQPIVLFIRNYFLTVFAARAASFLSLRRAIQ